jgi:phosphoglycerate dehydrogenase-like enzyme
LISALRERRIAGAAIDIFPNEPEVASELRELENIILSPHIASTTNELIARRAELAAANVQAFFAARPLKSQLV